MKSWLFLMARSRAADAVRSNLARKRREQERAVEDLRISDPDPADRFQAKATVQTALEVLSAEQRQCVTLAFFEGFSISQISDHLGIPLGTAKSRYLYGMRKLRDSFAGEEGSNV